MTSRYTTDMAAKMLVQATAFFADVPSAVGITYDAGGTFLPFAKEPNGTALWLGAFSTQEAAEAELQRVNEGGTPDRTAQNELEWDLLIG